MSLLLGIVVFILLFIIMRLYVLRVSLDVFWCHMLIQYMIAQNNKSKINFPPAATPQETNGW
jgi:hypothetical protein